MDDAQAVRGGEGTGDFSGVRQGLIERDRALLDSRGEGLAFEVFHHQEVDAVVSAGVVQGADVRVTQRRDGMRLALEPCPELSIARELSRQDFQGDGAIQASVGGAVNLSHATCPDQEVDAVGPQHGTGFQFGRIVVEHGCGRLEHRLIDQHCRAVVLEKRLDLAPELFVGAARLRQKRGTVARVPLEDRRIELSDAFPALGVHAKPSGGRSVVVRPR